jgi:dTDP-glucose 4,6-dehydratase
LKILVTGGAGFIGSAVVRRALAQGGHHIVNVDKLTYAGNLESLAAAGKDPRHRFYQVDIADREAVRAVLADEQPDAVMNLAAESHVDRSIDGPTAFVQTNVVGTFHLLEESRRYYEAMPPDRRARFRFLHVSTDEVFGSLGATGIFDEQSRYQPNSPYAATKAAADHLVRAWGHTYDLPVLTTNCSNNYGPYQFPEKLVPVTILNALAGKRVPVYGKGTNVRDWLYVDDHAAALLLVLERGKPGEMYNISGANERQNLEMVHAICDLLDELKPLADGGKRRALVEFVADRPGHDLRYAVDAGKIGRELGWKPATPLTDGLRTTVAWYLAEADGWCRRLREKRGEQGRLGLRRQEGAE